MTFLPINSLALYVLAIVAGAHLIDMALFGGILFVLVPEILKQFGVPLEWGNIVFAHPRRPGADVQLEPRPGHPQRDLPTAAQAARPGHRREAASTRSNGGETVPIPTGTGRTLLTVRDVGVEFGAVKALQHGDAGRHGGLHRRADRPERRRQVHVRRRAHRVPAAAHGRVRAGRSPARRASSSHQRAKLGLRRTYQQDRVPPTLTVGAFVDFVTNGQASAGRDR